VKFNYFAVILHEIGYVVQEDLLLHSCTVKTPQPSYKNEIANRKNVLKQQLFTTEQQQIVKNKHF